MEENKMYEMKFDGNEVDLDEILKFAAGIVKDAQAKKADQKMEEVLKC